MIKNKITHSWRPWIVFFSFILMVASNYVANQYRWGGNTTGSISMKISSLFTPAGFTFSIWALIYLSLGIFIAVFWKSLKSWGKLATLLTISSGLNILWLWSWHHELLGVSSFVILLLLAVLSLIYLEIRTIFPKDSAWIHRTPFSLYLAWICVASIANIAIWITAAEWPDLPKQSTTIVMVLAATSLGAWFTLAWKDWIFSLVLIWSLAGILSARTAIKEQIPQLYGTLLVAVIILILVVVFRLVRWNDSKFDRS